MNQAPRWLVVVLAFAAGWLANATLVSWPHGVDLGRWLLESGWLGLEPSGWLDRLLGPGPSGPALFDLAERLAPLLLLGAIGLFVLVLVSGRAALIGALCLGVAGVLVLSWGAGILLNPTITGYGNGYPGGGPAAWLAPIFGPTATPDPLARLLFLGLLVALVATLWSRRSPRATDRDPLDEPR